MRPLHLITAIGASRQKANQCVQPEKNQNKSPVVSRQFNEWRIRTYRPSKRFRAWAPDSAWPACWRPIPTSRFSRMSRAPYSSPIPPASIIDSTAYAPNRLRVQVVCCWTCFAAGPRRLAQNPSGLICRARRDSTPTVAHDRRHMPGEGSRTHLGIAIQCSPA
jgi:hypothetical protein